MRNLAYAVALVLPAAALAVGSDDNAPPKPTDTTMTCTDGMVWSEEAKKCVAPKESSLTDDELYRAVRELAYAGRYEATLAVLAAMSDQQDDRVLTYKGFVHRNMGNSELGLAYYRQAIDANPDNLLARSYMGQGFVADGRLEAARTELSQIRARGGRGTWAEAALMMAIDAGRVSAY